MKVLYLTEWYPHRYDAMSGLFVRKHAAAAAGGGADVCVLYFLPDPKVSATEIVEQTTAAVREIYVYYNGTYLSALRAGYKTLRERWGLPDIVQLNVLTKNGLLARYLRFRFRIPYVIVEHWSGYLPENGQFRNGMHGLLMKHIARHAACILPVSQALEDAMKACGIRCRNWERIHNAVDDFFFTGTPVRTEVPPFRFLHVSCFDERAKNTQGILRAAEALSRQRTDFEIRFIGTGPDFNAAVSLSDELGLTGRFVFFEGEKTPREVHQAMLSADCFILFSRYETAGVVLSECLATGLPMIASRAGAIPEIVNDADGILVESGNTAELTAAMDRMIGHAADYNADEIRLLGREYTEESVRNKLLEIYHRYAH